MIPSLRALADQERATAKKARASWQMFTIMAEFIEAIEDLLENAHNTQLVDEQPNKAQ